MDTAAYLASIQLRIDDCALQITSFQERKAKFEELLALLNSSPDALQTIELIKELGL